MGFRVEDVQEVPGLVIVGHQESGSWSFDVEGSRDYGCSVTGEKGLVGLGLGTRLLAAAGAGGSSIGRTGI